MWDESQIAAIRAATNPDRRLIIISGGAGTGKTTIIKAIAEKLTESGQFPELCAFAGKAAARLREATGFQASTIHRLLGYRGEMFSRGQLTGIPVIIDEASMVSSDLLAEIVRRNPAKIILVGDPMQLPPVGKGQVFHDTINLFPEINHELKTCYRNSEAIFQSAMKIRSGQMPDDFISSESERWNIINTGDAERTHKTLLSWIKSGQFDFQKDIILCPRNGDNPNQPAAVKSLNQTIRDIVNPSDSDEPFRIGDRVMNTKNFAEFDVWNGTTGTVHAIDSDGQIWVDLDIPAIKDYGKNNEPIYTDKILFDKKMKKSLQLAYAVTVHKSQGSQYRNVIFVALERDYYSLIDRSLIYTAVTRAQSHCVVIGQKSALRRGIQKQNHKTTVFQELAAIQKGGSE